MLGFDIKTNWDLTIFYKDISDPQIESDTEKLKDLVENFVVKYKGGIKNLNPDGLVEFFEKDNELDLLIDKIGSFYFYLSSLDTQNQQVLKKQAEFENLMTELSNKTLFISQEFKEIGYEKLMEFSQNPVLKDYSNYFVKKANSIKYLLDEKTEFALNLKENSGGSAFQNLYEELTNSFLFKVIIDGEEKVMTEDEVRSLRMSAKEEVRKEAIRSIREVYTTKQNQITLGNVYSAVIKDWTSEIKLREYDNVMSPRHLSQQIPLESINLLLSEVEKAYPLYHRYLKVKAKLLGKDKLMDWDLLAPVTDSDKTYSYEEGLEMYLDLLKDFDQEFYDYICELAKSGRVDVFPKPGKRSGAFCVYDCMYPSYVFLNFTNKLNDVSTIAHEFGHSIHAYMSRVQKPQVYYSGLALGETASIFSETLLNNKLRQQLPEKDQLALLESNLQDMFSTIFVQVQFTLFERKVHETVISSKELSYEDYNLLWREEKQKLTGDAVEYSVEGEKDSAWSAIPHIFNTPFYCYAYAFGNILSLALYEKYEEEGKDFVEKYKNILRSGDSKPPYELLIENGIDIKSPEFYQKGIKTIESMVEELERLAETMSS